ncbi:methionine--tRNA ligase [Candidatus Dependentiae bacterium]|nr:methionine--tRNA ligase [Candidatus Dependentiae bacterium]
MKRNRFYVTTPIYYVTAAPHLGSLYSTLLADVAARFHKLFGKEVFFLTGTDEHGQKIAEAAKKADKDPKEFVDSFIPVYKDIWKLYNIDYSKFMRTTDEYHVHAVQKWIIQLQQQGDIYKGQYIGWYCTPCETYVTEKDIPQGAKEVTCPSCLRPTNQLSEECYFFKLSAYQDRLLELYQNYPDFITPKERLHEVISFVKEGLKDLSISRTTISWGIPFPGDAKHVTYVWADALNNYITAIGYGSQGKEQELEYWWPADMQILGKDIVRFHAVYWPAFLMATGLAMPKTLLVHGWIKVGEQKMSKSLGNAVDPKFLADTYGVDVIRYYLTRKMTITHDSQFSLEDIEKSINDELANDLGNLLNRCLVLAYKYNYTTIQSSTNWSNSAQKLQTECGKMAHEVIELVELGYLYRAVARIWDFIHLVNAFMQQEAPWKTVNLDKALFEDTIAAVIFSLRTIGIALWPVMPEKMEKLLMSLGYNLKITPDQNILYQAIKWHGVCTLVMLEPLFQKYERKIEEKTEEEKKILIHSQAISEGQTAMKNIITIDDFVKVDMRVGLIEHAEPLEKSDKLMKLQVDFGPLGKRQILSGVRKYLTVDDLQGKKGIFVINFAPRMMMGYESQGMMLTAESDGNLSILQPGADIALGSKIK